MTRRENERIADERGFGLAEAIPSLLILGVVLSSMVPALVPNNESDSTPGARTGAVAVAQETMDNLRAVGEDWPLSGAEEEVTTGLGTYDTQVTHQRLCDESQCYDGARRVRVQVSQRGQVLYRVETVLKTLDADAR